MKLQLCLTIVFISFITVNAGTYENLVAYQDDAYQQYPHIACAICRGVAQESCRGCPFFEDIPFCEFVEQYESLTGNQAHIFENGAALEGFKGNCSSDYGRTVKFGHILTALETDSQPSIIFECIFCNVLIGIIRFITDDIILGTDLHSVLDFLCTQIKGCNEETVDALLVGLEGVVANLYVVIGQKVLGCPSYPTLYDHCVANN